ncbi:SDR family NAD(P)-dependent oxidoreductase [Acrocarpospora catenulata]|uniref:SDR family NAD(P)-dependent oxidoreductase n=1 Tax=Acrocarpospora catenulata TaxID=2836182 RepID=UPI001BDA84E3|nr:SDR family NAD(P)-dependent oxidoreductase [Acrocarpospora catenulata]
MTQQSSLRFDGETVIITGAGRGIGREHALLFAARGANVVVNDVGVTSSGEGEDLSVASLVVDEILAAGGSAVTDRHSVAETEGAEALVQTALDAFGRVDVLVNNAGIITFGLFADLDDRAWDQMMAVTLGGTYRTCRAVWPHFVAAGGGRIVNTTSNAGLSGCEQLSHYGAAKSAVAGLTKTLAIEGRPHGIRANAIAPMAVTRMNSDHFFGGAVPANREWQADIVSGAVPIGPASLVPPTAVWLAHRATEANGGIYSTSSGKVARVGIVIGEGYFNPDHTPEDLVAAAHEVEELRDYLDPTTNADEIASIATLFKEAQG